jgi:hypothetical protein
MSSTTQLSISRYKGGRHWAVREADSGSLVVVTVYRKGAAEVVRRLTGQEPKPARRLRRIPRNVKYGIGGAA